MLQPSDIERVLVVMAHPDDVDFSAAGTVAVLTDAGVEVVYCLVTDGQAGGFDRSIPRTEMAAIRREEQTKAAAEVGVTSLHFLGHIDGSVEVDDGSPSRHQQRHPHGPPPGRDHPSPVRNLASTYGSHPDHIAVGEAAMCAVYPDAAESVRVPRPAVCRTRGLGGRRGVDPERARGERVRRHHRRARPQDAALRCHISQHVDPDAMEARVRAWWGSIAVANGLAEGSTAESFRVVDTR